MAKKTPEYTIPVKFGNASIGDEVGSMSISISRQDLSLAKADKILCGRRIVGEIIARASGNPESNGLPGMESDAKLSGTFDTNSISVKRKKLSCKLSFSLDDATGDEVKLIACRGGVLNVFEVSEVPDGKGNKGAEEPADDEGDK